VTGELTEKDFGSADFKKFLGMCVNCKACSLQCPSGVDISKLMCAARAEYVKRRGLTAAERLLSNNRFLSKAGSMFGPVANFVMGLGVSAWAMEKVAGLDARRRMPKFGFGSFISKGKKYLAEAGPLANPVDRVAYFVDTFANFNDHELGFAVLKVLRHNNIEVILPKQVPAPLPAIIYGDVMRARKDLAYNVAHLAEAVGKGYKIVCSEPSAALCLKDELKYFVSGRGAELVSANTSELMNYLLDLHRQGKLKAAAEGTLREFAYHSPCHLLAIGDNKASIQLLKAVCDAKITDLNAGCCGLAGTFGMQKKNYELSSQISVGLAEALGKSGKKEVLTECAACAMQIEHISDCRTVHPVKVLAAAYGL
jgi:Fe-S oxidoreductase